MQKLCLFLIVLVSNFCSAYPIEMIAEQRVSDEICIYQTSMSPDNIKGFYSTKSRTIYLTRTADLNTIWHERGHALCDRFCTKEDLKIFSIEGCEDNAYYEGKTFIPENYKCSTEEQFAKEFAFYMTTRLRPKDERKLIFFNRLLAQ